jgi:hypothetical protein
LRFLFAARRSWNIRAAPPSTATSPPHTAASKIATPNGSVHRKPRKANDVDSVFWAMKTNRTVRIKKPKKSETHRAAARVKPTSVTDLPDVPDSVAGSGGGATGGTGGVGPAGEACDSLLMTPSLPVLDQKETTKGATSTRRLR